MAMQAQEWQHCEPVHMIGFHYNVITEWQTPRVCHGVYAFFRALSLPRVTLTIE